MDSLPEKIVDSIVDPSLMSSALDLDGLGLDKLLDETFLKDLPIPIFDTLIKSGHLLVNVRDKIFIGKVVKFLFSLSSVPTEKREAFKKKITEDVKFKKKVGEKLVLILDRLDDLEKPEMIAKAFECYLMEQINFADFRRVASAIDIAFTDDLRILLGKPIEKAEFGGDYIENLLKAGLVKIDNIIAPTTLGQIVGKVSYSLSPTGHLFKMIMTGEWYNPTDLKKHIQIHWT